MSEFESHRPHHTGPSHIRFYGWYLEPCRRRMSGVPVHKTKEIQSTCRCRTTHTRPNIGQGAVDWLCETDAMPSAAPPDDLGRLMTRVRVGDQEAFAAVYDGTAAMVFGVVLRVIRDHGLAEEVTQEVYVEAWRTASRFDAAKGSVHAWLNILAHRRAVDRVRSVQRSAQRDVQHAAREVAADSSDASEDVIANEQRVEVRKALATLPDAQRAVLVLAYFDGRTQRELAEELQVPLGTVKTRMRDGMQRLRDRLGEGSR